MNENIKPSPYAICCQVFLQALQLFWVIVFQALSKKCWYHLLLSKNFSFLNSKNLWTSDFDSDTNETPKNNVCITECYLCWQVVSPSMLVFQCNGWMLHSLPWLSLDLLYLCRLVEGTISTSHLPDSPFRESFSSLLGYKYVLFFSKEMVSLFPLQSMWAWETGIQNHIQQFNWFSCVQPSLTANTSGLP